MYRNPDKFGSQEQRARLLDSITARDFPQIKPELPKQENAHDCGLFLLEYFETFNEQPDFVLANLLNPRLKDVLFTQTLLNSKRKYIEKMLVSLQKSTGMKPPQDTLNKEYQEKAAEAVKAVAKSHLSIRKEVFSKFLRLPIDQEDANAEANMALS